MPKTNIDYENIVHNVICFENGNEFGRDLIEFLSSLSEFVTNELQAPISQF